MHARFARALRHAPMMVWMADDSGSVIFVNRKWLTFTGRRLRDELGDGWAESVHPDDLRSCLESYRGAVAEQAPITFEYRLRRFDGVYRSITDCALPIHDADGRFAGYVGSCIDVSAQRETSSAMLDGLIAHMNDGVFAETEVGQVAVVNASFTRIFEIPALPAGATAAEVRARVAALLAKPEDCCRVSCCRGEQMPVSELRTTDGRVLEQEHFSVPLESERIIHVWQFRDITHRKREEEELRLSRHRLRDLSAHLESAREEERRDLGRTLHDEVGQLLTGIRLEVASAVDRFRARGTAADFPIVDRLQAAVGLVDLSIATVRRVTSALRPPVLEHLGLMSAVRWEAAVFRRRTGIRCRVSSGQVEVEDRTVATILYRILLEALTNVARHAHAGTVWISVQQRPGRITMEVRDNGKGISDEALKNPATMGLLGMRERALAAGGEVRIVRRRAGGTSVQVSLPLPEGVKAQDAIQSDA
jgi:PAS domain S-box-containing protein